MIMTSVIELLLRDLERRSYVPRIPPKGSTKSLPDSRPFVWTKVSENWVSVVELFWMFYVPFLFEFVVGAIVTTLLPIVINCGIAAWKRWHE